MNKDKIKEIGTAVVKSGVGLIPYVGPLFSELISIYSNKKAKKRFETWANMVEERLQKLDKKIDENNEKFFSAMVKTTQIVAKTHQEEKLEYLANALINSSNVDTEDDLIQYFLELVERYTPSHIKALKYYRSYYLEDKENCEKTLEKERLKSIYSSQLASDGLLGFNNKRSSVDMVVLPLGMLFLSFISNKGGDKDEE